MLEIKHFEISTPDLPEKEGWELFWHGYYQMKKVRSAGKRKADRRVVKRIDYYGDYFERDCFLSILSAVKKDQVNMFELGAGRGDWCLSLAGVVDHKIIPLKAGGYRCLAVEGEPTHHQWTEEHFTAQNINGVCVFGAVSDRNGETRYYSKEDPADHYGQCITPDGNITVPTYTVDYLRREYEFPKIDIIHMDVQGAEYDVLIGAEESLDRGLIDYLMIGTHSTALNIKIRGLLSERFNNLVDYYPETIMVESDDGNAIRAALDGLQVYERKLL